eukprot:1679029-Karenia_brevis.AAC.1
MAHNISVSKNKKAERQSLRWNSSGKLNATTLPRSNLLTTNAKKRKKKLKLIRNTLHREWSPEVLTLLQE